MSDVKMSNRGLILRQIKDTPKPRKDIAEKIRLTPAAVTILVNELIEQGCIRESGQVNEPSRVGRKKVFIELNKDYKYAFGISIEGSHMNVCIGNLKCEVLDFVNIKIKDLQAEKVLELAKTVIEDMMKERHLSKDRIVGVGLGIVGNVDTKHGISKHAYGLWKKEVKVKEYLEEALGLHVIVENNVRALALAEVELTTHKKIRNMVFMKLGPGVGSAVILDNEIYKGSYNNSGELGHMIIDLKGKKCRCGQTGCLETVASIASLYEEIKEDFSVDQYPILYEKLHGNLDNISEDFVMDAYIAGDEQVIKKVDQLICYLSIGVINSIKMYDPHKIIIYSNMFSNPIFMNKLIQASLVQNSAVNLEERLEPSSLTTEKSVGGLVLVINKRFFKLGAMEIT